jgi:dephospho-CoA kinase
MRTDRFAIGLTGGIGCGKSTVADMFAARGAAVIDTDMIAHQLTAADGAAIPAIRSQFGDDFITSAGALDRNRMREKAFSDPAAKRQLESILHPLIRTAAEQAAQELPGDYLLFVVPLLIESGNWKRRVERVLVVDCQHQTQIARVMRRSGLTEQQVLAIMQAQVSREARLAVADDVIVNDGEAAVLVPQVDRLHAQYLAAALSRPDSS